MKLFQDYVRNLIFLISKIIWGKLEKGCWQGGLAAEKKQQDMLEAFFANRHVWGGEQSANPYLCLKAGLVQTGIYN